MRDNKKDGPSPLCLVLVAGYFYLFCRTVVSDRGANASSLNLIALTQRVVPCINIFTNNSGICGSTVFQGYKVTAASVSCAKIASISPKMLLLKPSG